MTLGERIRAARLKAGLSQPELAKRAGVVNSFISMLETGKRTRVGSDILARIAAALDIPIDALLNATPTEDLSQPPVNLFRAAGWAEDVITAIVDNWIHQPGANRSKIVARAKQRAQEAQAVADARVADEKALRAELGPLSLIL